MSPYKTEQEVFDAAYNGMRAQGFAKAESDDGTYTYISKDGNKCAIGQCLGEDIITKLSPQNNGKPINGLMNDDMKVFDLFQNISRGFLSSLQITHDQGKSPEGIKERMELFASDHKLTIPQENQNAAV